MRPEVIKYKESQQTGPGLWELLIIAVALPAVVLPYS